jgi:hypothetical protein
MFEMPTCFRAVVLVVCAVTILTSTARAEADLEARRAADLAASPRPGFTIAFESGRDTVRIGETIPLVLRLEGYTVMDYNFEFSPALGHADVVVDRDDGWADPRADMWTGGLRAVPEGVIGCASTGTVAFTVYLNQAVRFDRAGTYRFYVRSRHALGGLATVDRQLISNVLEIHVVDADPAWESATLEAAQRAIDDAETSKPARARAIRALKFLGTRGAVDAMLARFAPVTPAPWWDATNWEWQAHWLHGLYGAPDRDYVVQRMTQTLEAADRQVGPAFLANLTVLELSRRTTARPFPPAAFRQQLRASSHRRLAALYRAGRLPAHFTQVLTRTAASGADVTGVSDVTDAYGDFLPQLAAAFATLPPRDQRIVLGGARSWMDWLDPSLVPWLRRLVEGRDPDGPQDAALRLLFTLAPGDARRLALRHLALADSAVGIEALSLLPDRTLPSHDAVLVRRLERAPTDTDYRQALDRIERFATGRIAARVRRAYERRPGAKGCRVGPIAMAYFLRVDPAYARRELATVSRTIYEGEGCDSGLLQAVAEREVTPDLEAIAIAHLESPNGWLVVDAANVLAREGSAAAEPALWAALARWHTTWEPRQAELAAGARARFRPWEHAAGDALRAALASGVGWRPGPGAEARLAASCLLEQCRDQLTSDFQMSAGPALSAASPAQAGKDPSFAGMLGTMAPLPDTRSLRRWLRSLPSGTRVRWFGESDVMGHGWKLRTGDALLATARTAAGTLPVTIEPAR